MRYDYILEAIIVFLLVMSASAIVGIRHWDSAQAVTAAKSAFPGAAPSFDAGEGSDSGFMWHRAYLVFVGSGEEAYRIWHNGLISGEGGRTIGRLTEHERKLFMKATGTRIQN